MSENRFEDEIDEGFGESSDSSPVFTFSRSGSIRGKKHSVRESVDNYKELVKNANEEKGKIKRNYEKEEQNRCVLYVTSMGIIREPFEKSRKMKAILSQLFIEYELRDIFISKQFKRELRERLNTDDVSVPVLFVNGKHFGFYESVEKLNECGQLSAQLSSYRKEIASNSTLECPTCGGSKFIPCQSCQGSRRTQIHHFFEDSISLKCLKCDYTGLQKCPKC